MNEFQRSSDAHRLLAAASLALPRQNYKTDVVANQFYDRLLLGLASAPGIQSVGIGSDLPWTGYDDNAGFNIESKQPPPHESFHGRYHAASPGYFRAL